MGLFKKFCPHYEPTSPASGRCLKGDSNKLTDAQCLEYCFSKFRKCPKYSKKTTFCPYSKNAGSYGYWCDISDGPGLYGQGTRSPVAADHYEKFCSDKYKRCSKYKP